MRAARLAVVVMSALSLGACEAKVATAEIAPTKLAFNNAGEGKSLMLTLKDSDGNAIEGTRPTAWTSADPKIAYVDENGMVKSAGTGTTTITAKVEEVSASVPVEVTLLKQVQLRTIALVLVAGSQSEALAVNYMNERGEPLTPDFEKIPAWKPAWKSANSAVATVDARGVVTGVTAGTTIITAHVGDLKTELTLTVNPPPDAPPLVPEAPAPGTPAPKK